MPFAFAALKAYPIVTLLKISTIAIKNLVEKLGPVLLGSAPVVSAIRKVMAESSSRTDEARLSNLEQTMGLQAALNEKIEVQLKIVQTLLENLGRSLKLLAVGLVGAFIIAISALIVAILK